MRVRLEVMGFGGEGRGVLVPRRLASALRVRGRSTTIVQVGQRQVQVRYSVGTSQTTLALSQTLLAALGLRKGMHMHAHAKSGILHLGPLVGILVPGTQGLPSPIGNMTLGIRYFIQEGRKAGVYAFAFSCRGVNWQSGVIRGYTLSWGEAGPRWVRRTFPLPDVVYDQITFRRRDRMQDVQRLRRRLREAGIPCFNPGYFSKWEVHEDLMQSPELHQHLPETRLLSVEGLREMMAQYRRVFIKPSAGSLGQGIRVVTRRAQGGLELRRALRQGHRSAYEDPERLVEELPTLDGDVYIMQQGIDLCTSRGRAVDVRVIMQRNGRGRWLTTKTFARVAPRGQLAANISAGATGLRVTGVLRRSFSAAKVQKIKSDIRRVSRLVCGAMVATVEGHIGELGIDLGVDRNGHVWVIEVNAKPHRKAYDTLEGLPTAQRSFRRPMQYAAFLAGFVL